MIQFFFFKRKWKQKKFFRQFFQPSNNHAPTTTQPSFVSNPRTISTQPSRIRRFSNHNSTTRKRIREAAVECEAYARPARTTRSLRAPHRHDFDARAVTRALYAGSQNHVGPANMLSRASRLSGLCASRRFRKVGDNERRFLIQYSTWNLMSKLL